MRLVAGLMGFFLNFRFAGAEKIGMGLLGDFELASILTIIGKMAQPISAQ
jgi:hypothetical protein